MGFQRAVRGVVDIVFSGCGAPGIVSAVRSMLSAPFDGSGWLVVRLAWRKRRARRVVRRMSGLCIVAGGEREYAFFLVRMWGLL